MNISNPKNTKTLIIGNLPVNISSITGKISRNVNSDTALIKNLAVMNCYSTDDYVAFNFIKTTNQSVKCIFEIEFDSLVKQTKDELIFSKDDIFYSLTTMASNTCAIYAWRTVQFIGSFKAKPT